MTLIYPLQEPQQGAEEYVVNVQGFLVEAYLPPIITREQ